MRLPKSIKNAKFKFLNLNGNNLRFDDCLFN